MDESLFGVLVDFNNGERGSSSQQASLDLLSLCSKSELQIIYLSVYIKNSFKISDHSIHFELVTVNN